MTTFTLTRPGDVDLVFDGELLADLTSRDHPDQERWTEVRIYRTASGKYVAEQVGKSTVDGERDRGNVRVVDDASHLPGALKRKMRGKGTPYLTDLAFQALEEAGTKDEAIAETLTERI
jgi:hypothetical protein